MKNSLTKNDFIQRCSQYFFIGCLLLLLGCSSDEKKVATATPSSKVTALDSISTWLSNENNYLEKNYHQVFFQHYTTQIKQQNIDSAAYLLEIALWAASYNMRCDSLLLQEGISFLQKYGDKVNRKINAILHERIGQSYWRCDDQANSFAYTQKAITLFPPDQKAKIAFMYAELAFRYLNTSKLDSATQFALKALKMGEDIDDPEVIGSACNTLACTFRFMGNYNEAINYDDKAIATFKKSKDTSNLFAIYNNKISLYDDMNHPDLYLTIDSLINLYNSWKPKNIVLRLEMQARATLKYVHENKLEQAKMFLDSIQLFIKDFKNDLVFEFYVHALSVYDLKKGQGTQHKTLYEEMIKKKQENKDYRALWLYNAILKQDATIRKDYKNALDYQNAISVAQDSLWNKDLRIKLADLDKKYQTEKKELIIKQQETDAFKKNIFIAFLLAGFAALFYFYYTVRKKNTIISQQNELNEHTIAILSHDIKEPLLGVKLMLKRLNKDDPFVAQASQSLESQINAVNGILTNLLKMKKLALTKKDKNVQADVNMVVKNVLQELNVAIQTKELTVENELTEGVLLPIAPEKLQIIVHNLLSNAVKYSFPNQKIRIFREGKGFCIQDFGVGLSPEQRSKLMREVTASQRGTSQERGNGLGLFLVGTMLQGEAIKVIFDSPEIGGTIAKVLVS